MKYTSIILLMLTSFIAYSQKGTFTIGGGSSLMVSGYRDVNMESVSGCCLNTELEDPTHFNYEPNYQKKFLMFSDSDLDLIPTIEVKYYLFDRLKLIGNIFGFKRRLKFNAGHSSGSYAQNYSLSYHDETIRLGASLGASFDVLSVSDKHFLSLGLLSTFDKVVQREIITDFGTFSDTWYNQKDFKTTEIFPPYTGTYYLLFAMLNYEFKFTKNWSAMTRFRYNPKLDFTRNYKQGAYKGARPIHRAILAFDLQLVYRFGGD